MRFSHGMSSLQFRRHVARTLCRHAASLMWVRRRWGREIYSRSDARGIHRNSGQRHPAALVEGELQEFLPEGRGKFTFPHPYLTEAMRITTAEDCGGADCVRQVGYSYWRNMNNHVDSNEMLIFLGLIKPMVGRVRRSLAMTNHRGNNQSRAAVSRREPSERLYDIRMVFQRDAAHHPIY